MTKSLEKCFRWDRNIYTFGYLHCRVKFRFEPRTSEVPPQYIAESVIAWTRCPFSRTSVESLFYSICAVRYVDDDCMILNFNF